MSDKLLDALLAGLRQALAEPGDHRLYRSGKLAGLFAGRTGANGDAAAQALRDGLLEPVRTETRGKSTIDWVRLTPKGVTFLHDNESPLLVLKELREVLRTTREGMPAWLVEMRQDLQSFGTRLADDFQRMVHRLDALNQRVEEALRRADALGPRLADGMGILVPWAGEALTYIDRRRTSGAPGDCPLPELFAAIRDQHADLTVTAFHDGLRRLQDWRVVRLLPFADATAELPEPEFALLDGASVFYYVAR